MKKTNTIALVGMIISIVSTLCCGTNLLCGGSLLGVICALAGGICSFIGYRRIRQNIFEQPYEKLAIAGIIIGIVSFILQLSYMLIFWGVLVAQGVLESM